MHYKGAVVIDQHWEAWMNLENPEVTMEQAVQKLRDLGNEIIEVDEVNRRIKVLNVRSDEGGIIGGNNG